MTITMYVCTIIFTLLFYAKTIFKGNKTLKTSTLLAFFSVHFHTVFMILYLPITG